MSIERSAKTNDITFKKLHQQAAPLLIANVWNAHTAALAEKAGFQAVATSSHAIANALGHEDGEEMSVQELLFIVKRIKSAVRIPVSVDFEAGYSNDPMEVAEAVKQLADLGVSGINLEDGIVQDGKRLLGDADLLVEKIKVIKSSIDIFINARTDTFTTQHPHALEEAIRRAQLYQTAGADGIFVPLIEKEEDIKSFVEQVNLPLNVFTTSNLPRYEQLAALGVKRISHGAKQYEQLMKKSEEIFINYYKTKDYKIILG
jgi:2-methylisocitrate lyase-like PEP mutase family enzyme